MSNNKIMKFIVPNLKLKSIRLDQIIAKHIPSVSRSVSKKWILLGYVSINKKIIRVPKKKFFFRMKFIFL